MVDDINCRGNNLSPLGGWYMGTNKEGPGIFKDVMIVTFNNTIFFAEKFEDI